MTFQRKSMDALGRLSIEEFKNTKGRTIIILLDNVRSMFNVGSVFRTADAFAIEAMVLCGITPKPPHREIHKTALGAENSMSWRYEKSAKEAAQKLKKEGYKIISVEQAHGSISLADFNIKPNEKQVLVFGHEVSGVSDEVLDLADVCVEIPQSGTKHSFNISVSVGMVLWQICH